MENGEDVLADLRYPPGSSPELVGMVPDFHKAEADRRLRDRVGTSVGHCRDCGLPVWWHDEKLVTRDGSHWCFGSGRTRMRMERWHALLGMPQYVVASPEGQICNCLARAVPHIHQIVETVGEEAKR